MVRLPSRQVHLDFHTSEHIPGVGSKFDKKQFQQALITGRLNSITVFAKCHHGWCYYPSRVGSMHPNLGFDLTGAMVDAAHEVGVRAPIYITMGWSANDALAHPEWRERNRDGGERLTNFDLDAPADAAKPGFSWINLCPNGSYAEHVYALTREICDRYPAVDGLFYDICFLSDACWCDACRAGMAAEGFDAGNDADARAYYILNRQRFMDRCTEILREKHTDATIFFNSGGADMYKPQYHAYQTHFEMEDLPTTWGGYDKMPPRAKFFARTGKDYLGMTGKFHTAWGEFGGFKNPEALRFECAAMLSYGARISVGDQMHPSGEMDMETYRLIGSAYAYAEQIEPYCFDAAETARLGIVLCGDPRSDEGLQKMLLEKQLDFDIALPGDDLSRFDALILPDCVTPGGAFLERLNEFARRGGAVLLTGASGLNTAGDAFALDTGAEYLGGPEYALDYIQAEGPLAGGIVTSPFLAYEGGHRVRPAGGEAMGRIWEPYFDRTYGKYCSHQNTPYRDAPSDCPAAVRKGNVLYLAHPLCRMYYEHGAQVHRDYLVNALRLIYTRPVMRVTLPSAGRARFVRQGGLNRYVLHLLYASPIQRGRALVIEDMPELRDIAVEADVREPVRSVTMEPGGEALAFRQEAGTVRFTVPALRCHAMAVLRY